MDIRPGKGMTTGQSDEHQRNWTERGWEWASKHGNYDRTRERLNFEVIKGGKVVPVDKSKSIPDRSGEFDATRLPETYFAKACTECEETPWECRARNASLRLVYSYE